jgi:hypothetical protein
MGKIISGIIKSAHSDWKAQSKSMKESGASRADRRAVHKSLRQKAKSAIRDARHPKPASSSAPSAPSAPSTPSGPTTGDSPDPANG